MVLSHAVRAGVPVSPALAKYSAKNSPVAQPPPAGVTVKLSAFDVWPSGLRTVTAALPAAATSVAGMAAVTRVALTKVVVRGAPFQSTAAPETKPEPSIVSVNAGLPAAVVFGVRVLTAGGTAPLLVQVTWTTASPPRS